MSCFGLETSADCIFYSGESYPSLGITDGMTLSEVLSALADSIASSQTPDQAANTSQLIYDGKSVLKASMSLEAAKVNIVTFPVSLIRMGNGVNVSYDLNSLIASLPQGHDVMEAKAKIKYSDGKSISSKGRAGSLTLSGSYPATASFIIQTATPGGIVELTSSITIPSAPNQDEQFTLIMKVNDLTPSDNTVKTLNEYLNILESEINRVKNLLM